MRCQKCGQENSEQNNFCSSCGSKLVYKEKSYKVYAIISLVLSIIAIITVLIGPKIKYYVINTMGIIRDKQGYQIGEDTEDIQERNDKIFYAIEQLQYYYDIAINTGDVSRVYPYITTTGNLYSSYNKNIPIWHDEGMVCETKQVDYTGILENSDGTYTVGRYSISKVNRKGSIKYEKEYVDFIVKNIDGNFIVDSCKNYKMIDSNYNY